ncbi:MAG: DNA double-strand break repair nuclease NurA [Candidatus Baldrarchaeia archaeon]
MEGLYEVFGNLLMRSCERSFMNLREKVRRHTKDIREGERADINVGFIDGSLSFDDRRGVGVFLFSACGLIVDGKSLRMHEFFCTSKSPVPHILFPKFLVQTRGNNLMSIFELMVALSMIRTESAHLILMDGSYISTLLAPAGALRALYRDIRNRLDRLRVQRFIDEVNSFLQEVIEMRFPGILEMKDAKRCFINFLMSSRNIATDFYRRLYHICSGAGIGEVSMDLLNYSNMCVEENFFLFLLDFVLEEAKDKGIAVAWFAKDSDSRFITRGDDHLKWLTDEAFLDEVWKDLSNVYIRISDISSLSPISHGRAAVRSVADKGDCIFQYDLAERFYKEWGGYDGIYVKFLKGPVFQITLPAHFSSVIDRIPSILLPMCEKRTGCPRPIIYVHFKALMKESVARLFADELWFKTPRTEWLIRVMLSRSGRRRIGV